eukprot:505660_1
MFANTDTAFTHQLNAVHTHCTSLLQQNCDKYEVKSHLINALKQIIRNMAQKKIQITEHHKESMVQLYNQLVHSNSSTRRSSMDIEKMEYQRQSYQNNASPSKPSKPTHTTPRVDNHRAQIEEWIKTHTNDKKRLSRMSDALVTKQTAIDELEIQNQFNHSEIDQLKHQNKVLFKKLKELQHPISKECKLCNRSELETLRNENKDILNHANQQINGLKQRNNELESDNSVLCE